MGSRWVSFQTGMAPAERHPAYAADITYGTNNEFGFDYLRDNMAMRASDRVQRGHAYAIVDEVDSILVDEARTPLIISGRVAETAKWYRDFARIVRRLQPEIHYTVDQRTRQVLTTEEGVTRVEKILGFENLFDHAAVDFVHHLEAALRAQALYSADVDYLIDRGEGEDRLTSSRGAFSRAAATPRDCIRLLRPKRVSPSNRRTRPWRRSRSRITSVFTTSWLE